MYPCKKFHPIWRTSEFEIKFAQENMNENNFEKINIKIKIFTIYFSFGTKFPKKTLYSGVLGQTQPENNLF